MKTKKPAMIVIALLFSMKIIGQTIPFRFTTTLNDSTVIKVYELIPNEDNTAVLYFIPRNEIVVQMYSNEYLLLFESNTSYYVSFFGTTSNYIKPVYVYCRTPPELKNHYPLDYMIDFKDSSDLVIQYYEPEKNYRHKYTKL